MGPALAACTDAAVWGKPLLLARLQHRLLQQLPPGPRAAAQAAEQHLRAAVARRRAGAAVQPESAAAATCHPDELAAAIAAAGSTPAAGATGAAAVAAGEGEEAPPLDAATSLLALFQRLSPAEKTHILLMGPAAAAAPLLPHLDDSEVSDVMLLLPLQRQEALLLALHPAQERRLRGAMREANRRHSSLLLPQQMAAAVAAVAVEAAAAGQQQGAEEAPEGTLAGEFQRLRRASSVAMQAPGLRRASSLLPGTAGALAAAAATAPCPDSAAGWQRQGQRRGSLLAPQQPQQRRDSRSASALA